MRVEREELEDERNVPPPCALPGDVRAAQPDRAGGGHFQPGDHSEGCRLAAARRPEQGEELAVMDGEIGVPDGNEVVKALWRPESAISTIALLRKMTDDEK